MKDRQKKREERNNDQKGMQKKGRLPLLPSLLVTALSGVCAWLFYPRLWFLLIGMVLGLVQGKKAWIKAKEREMQDKKERVLVDFFDAMINHLEAGDNPPASWAWALDQVQRKWQVTEGQAKGGEKNCSLLKEPLLVRQLGEVLRRYRGGMGFDCALKGLAEEKPGLLLEDYLHHFILGIHQGADLAKLTKSFYRLLVDERELAQDRQSKLAGARREQAILFIMPFLLLCAMRMSGMGQSGGGGINLLLHIFCLLLFYLAWRWSQSIIRQSGLMD